MDPARLAALRGELRKYVDDEKVAGVVAVVGRTRGSSPPPRWSGPRRREQAADRGRHRLSQRLDEQDRHRGGGDDAGGGGKPAVDDPKNEVYFVLMIQGEGFGDGDMSDIGKTLQGAGEAPLAARTAAAS